jgi:hypothetical protein
MLSGDTFEVLPGSDMAWPDEFSGGGMGLLIVALA